MDAEQHDEPAGGVQTEERPPGSRAPRFVRERRPLHLSWQAGVFLAGLAVVIAGAVMLVVSPARAG